MVLGTGWLAVSVWFLIVIVLLILISLVGHAVPEKDYDYEKD
jgi:hypothetical protein